MDILLPVLAMAFITENCNHPGLRRHFAGVFSGWLTAAAIWELLIPAMESTSQVSFVLAFLGIWLGFLGLPALERLFRSEPLRPAIFPLLAAPALSGYPLGQGVSAGAILYAAVEKLIPEMAQHTPPDNAILSFAAGFTLRMAMG